jgi:site-specific DNA recombinase
MAGRSALRNRRDHQEIAEQLSANRTVRCAIYTRKSTEEGLQQEFNSLDAQREAAEAFIASQRHEGWTLIPDSYDDGGYTGANMERPALKRLLADIEAEKVDCVVVYKVDRLSRSLLDFARMVAIFEKRGASFVSVTQQFNTTASLGRLTLNILLSFAQFERELIAERTRDKMSAARRKGKWVGGSPVLGYDVAPGGGKLVVNEDEARRVRAIFDLYLEYRTLIPTVGEINRRGWTTKQWTTKNGREHCGKPFTKSGLFGEHKNPGDQAAFFAGTSSTGRNPGYHFRNVSSSRLSRTQVRVCSSRWAPFFVHCICWRLANRLLTIWFTADSTNPVAIASSFRHRSP